MAAGVTMSESGILLNNTKLLVALDGDMANLPESDLRNEETSTMSLLDKSMAVAVEVSGEDSKNAVSDLRSRLLLDMNMVVVVDLEEVSRSRREKSTEVVKNTAVGGAVPRRDVSIFGNHLVRIMVVEADLAGMREGLGRGRGRGRENGRRSMPRRRSRRSLRRSIEMRDERRVAVDGSLRREIEGGCRGDVMSMMLQLDIYVLGWCMASRKILEFLAFTSYQGDISWASPCG
jgi:hypothetical protein